MTAVGSAAAIAPPGVAGRGLGPGADRPARSPAQATADAESMTSSTQAAATPRALHPAISARRSRRQRPMKCGRLPRTLMPHINTANRAGTPLRHLRCVGSATDDERARRERAQARGERDRQTFHDRYRRGWRCAYRAALSPASGWLGCANSLSRAAGADDGEVRDQSLPEIRSQACESHSRADRPSTQQGSSRITAGGVDSFGSCSHAARLSARSTPRS